MEGIRKNVMSDSSEYKFSDREKYSVPNSQTTGHTYQSPEQYVFCPIHRHFVRFFNGFGCIASHEFISKPKP